MPMSWGYKRLTAGLMGPKFDQWTSKHWEHLGMFSKKKKLPIWGTVPHLTTRYLQNWLFSTPKAKSRRGDETDQGEVSNPPGLTTVIVLHYRCGNQQLRQVSFMSPHGTFRKLKFNEDHPPANSFGDPASISCYEATIPGGLESPGENRRVAPAVETQQECPLSMIKELTYILLHAIHIYLFRHMHLCMYFYFTYLLRAYRIV